MHETNLSRADLNLLVVFDAVAQTRSVTGAAEALSLSQPAVSQALKRLRTLMGDPLFVRGRDCLVLTPRAEGSVVEVKAILAAVGRVLKAERFDSTTTARSFRFGASDYAMMTTIPAIVGRLRAGAPQASIDVAHIEADLLPRLEKGEIDLAFVGASHPDGPFLSRELFRERFVGLVCRRHPLAIKAGQGALSAKDYLAYPHVAVTFRDPRRSPIDAKLTELGKQRRVAMVTPNFAANIGHGPRCWRSPPGVGPRARRGLVAISDHFSIAPEWPGPPKMVARREMRPTEADARALLVHCAQEMAHLASFLP